ncbi:hypothetical protein Tco_0031303 [Tanacetum coccineum]
MFRIGPLGYFTRTDNRPSYGEKRPSLEELMNRHQEESARRSAKMEEWIKKLQENSKINTRNQSASLKNLETQIEQLTKELHSRTANGAPSSYTRQCKVVNADQGMPSKLNNVHEVSFLSDYEFQVAQNEKEKAIEIIHSQLLPKELNLGNFTLPCIIALDPDKNPMEMSFDDYKWVFDLEIEKLADEYEIGIGEKGFILEEIWENCRKAQCKNKDWWYDYWLKEDEKQESRDKEYDPPKVPAARRQILRPTRPIIICLGFGNIAGGLDHVSPIIRLPIEHGISKAKRVRAMNMTLQSSIKDRILAARNEAVDESAGLQKGKLTSSTSDVLQEFNFFLQTGLTDILTTLEDLGKGLCGEDIREDKMSCGECVEDEG